MFFFFFLSAEQSIYFIEHIYTVEDGTALGGTMLVPGESQLLPNRDIYLVCV